MSGLLAFDKRDGMQRMRRQGVARMKKMWWADANPIRLERLAKLPALFLAIALVAAASAPPARAALGYELDPSHPSRALVGAPRGVAVDPTTQDIYVAILSTDSSSEAPGQIERFNSDLSADATLAQGNGYYSGVALDPATNDFYAAQMEIRTVTGNLGTSKMDRFSALGAPAGSFALPYTASLPDIATDSAGNVFYPNVSTHSVQVFDSTGLLLKEITCGGCPGGSFGQPASVALDSTDNLYVADASPNRVVKMTLSAGSYSFASVLQSGRGAGAVAVDAGTGDVLVGDMPAGKNYHIVAYDSSGVQFDDFAAGIFPNSSGLFGPLPAYQMAVNPTTHKLYVVGTDKLYAFEKATIAPPATTIKPATGVVQLTATLNATVNANGHAVLECEFEYIEEADFLANGFANAVGLPCSEKPDGSGATALTVKAPGLAPGTDYRYRITAMSNAGSVSSGSATFETLPEIAPTVTTESPLVVTQTAATIGGRTNPHGGSASNCHFDFGTSLSYGSSIPCSALPGPATTDVAESGSVSGLVHSTTYHYRLVVSTNAGTTAGNDVAFTTPSPPPIPEPGPAPPVAPPATTPTPAGPVVAPRPLRCKKGFQRRRLRGKVRCVRKKRRHRHARR
jgi:DNA-binding beta-propeller fold protein YncE